MPHPHTRLALTAHSVVELAAPAPLPDAFPPAQDLKLVMETVPPEAAEQHRQQQQQQQ